MKIKIELPDLPVHTDKYTKWGTPTLGPVAYDNLYLANNAYWATGSVTQAGYWHIVSKPEKMTHKEIIEEQGYKVGDRVRITHVAKPGDRRWGASWIPAMTRAVGTVQTILEVDACSGYGIKIDGSNRLWCYPAFVCEKVETTTTVDVTFKGIITDKGQPPSAEAILRQLSCILREDPGMALSKMEVTNLTTRLLQNKI